MVAGGEPSGDRGDVVLCAGAASVGREEPNNMGRGANDPRGGCRVVGADDERDIRFASSLDYFFINFECACDDEESHAELKAAILDVSAVADNDDATIRGEPIFLVVATKGANIHRADTDEEFLDFVNIVRVEYLGIERVDDGLHAGFDSTHGTRFVWLRDEKFAKLEDGDQAFDLSTVVHNREGANIVLVD